MKREDSKAKLKKNPDDFDDIGVKFIEISKLETGGIFGELALIE
jgi:hypothetical protein